jgi:hypothetical protein
MARWRTVRPRLSIVNSGVIAIFHFLTISICFISVSTIIICFATFITVHTARDHATTSQFIPISSTCNCIRYG